MPPELKLFDTALVFRKRRRSGELVALCNAAIGKTIAGFQAVEVVSLVGRASAHLRVKCQNCGELCMKSYDDFMQTQKLTKGHRGNSGVCRFCHGLPQGEAGLIALLRKMYHADKLNGRECRFPLEWLRYLTSLICHW